MARIWSETEVERIVEDYFKMLRKELTDKKFSKTDHRNIISDSLDGRSDGSIEFKHQNISAVLIEFGLPYISGYKPRYNYQNILKDAIEDYLSKNNSIFKLFEKFIESEIAIPGVEDILSCLEKKPVFHHQVAEQPVYYSPNSAKKNYFQEELQNTKIGLLGEKFVINFEKARLLVAGCDNLSDKVVHVSQSEGDSAGFDILSFDTSGSERYIEVKTTKFGKESPFFITKNELEFSRSKLDMYYLYRLFNFHKNPKMFLLNGSIDKSCLLTPTQYVGLPI